MVQPDSPVFNRKSLLTHKEEVELCRLIKAGDEADRQLEALNCRNSTDKHFFESSFQGDIASNGSGKIPDEPSDSEKTEKPPNPQKLKKLLTESEKGRAALGTFVEANMGLVVYMAQRYQNKGFSTEDLIQEGYLALIQGIHSYDPDKGYKFSSYVSSWIYFHMLKALKKQTSTLKMSDNQIVLLSKLNRAYIELSSDLGRPPSAAELSKELEVSIQEVQKMLKAKSSHLSLEHAMGEGGTLGDTVEYSQDLLDSNTILEAVDLQNVYYKEISRAMQDLHPHEREVLKMRFGLCGQSPLQLQEIVDELSQKEGRTVTISAVRRIEEKALRKLRSAIPDIGENLDLFNS